MTHVDLHTLTGACALDALSEREAREFAVHLAVCGACAQEVGELRETAARLAFAVAEVPPAGMRARVMGALPEVRQLAPAVEEAARVVPVRGRWRRRLPSLALAACLALAVGATGVAVVARHAADQERSRSVRAERQADRLTALLAAPDASYRAGPVAAGGTGAVVSSRALDRAAFVYHGLPRLPAREVYELWFRRGGAMVPAGLLARTGSSGTALLTGRTAGADGVGLTVEPAGGSKQPTTTPLMLLSL